eukprot:6845951-Prymnesium_polylepis.1
MESAQSMPFDAPTCLTEQQSALCRLRWKTGSEPPPFLSTDIAIMELLKAIVDGTAETVPQIAVSKAVAVQIYRLIY